MLYLALLVGLGLYSPSSSFLLAPSGVVLQQGLRSSLVEQDAFEELAWEERGPLPCVVYDTLQEATPYADAWEKQKELLQQRLNDESLPDCMMLVQHNPVFTLGTGSVLDNLKFPLEDPPFEVFRVERGGEVTYHGPGQIVMYPIIDLKRYRQDIHWYLRALEEVTIMTLARFGKKAERFKGLTGVWVDGRKVAAVGVKVKRWHTMHGVAINVTTDLADFQHIVPCGISDRAVGSVSDFCADVTMEQVRDALLNSFEHVFGVTCETTE